MNVYLIQRAVMKDKKAMLVNIFHEALRFDYMGAAEFEYGALPKSIRRIYVAFDKLVIVGTGIRDINMRELFVLCHENVKDKVVECVTSLATKNDFRLKEWCDMKDYINGTRSQNDFWWDITNDWMACTGKDRLVFIKECIENSRKSWLEEVSQHPILTNREDGKLYRCMFRTSIRTGEFFQCDVDGNPLSDEVREEGFVWFNETIPDDFKGARI